MDIADRKQIPLSVLLATYSSREVEYWKFYYSKEPSESTKIIHILSQLTSLFHNTKYKDKKSPSDFMYPDQWKTEIQIDVESIRKMLTGK